MACFDLGTPCDVACTAAFDCGVGGDPVECVNFFCPDGQISPPVQGLVDCAVEHLADGACDDATYWECVGGGP